MPRRKICIFTGNRAEYGLQYPILKAVDAHPDLDYQLIASGAHLDPNFGETLAEIQADGFRIAREIKIEFGDDSLYATVGAIGSCAISLAAALKDLDPDILVVYADRFEGFAAVIAGTQMGIPTAHIEGGDITDGGALDDSVRHAMSKLSHLHFTTNQQASNRLLGMGEEPWRVHTVGFPAIDLIMEGNFATAEELSERYGLSMTSPIVLFTQHSVTTEFDQAAEQLGPSIDALQRLAEEGVQSVVTYPNNDAGGRRIIASLQEFKKSAHKNIQFHKSLGRYNYHGILALARNANLKVACVGNSSSGIKETPAFGCPTVNIGSRQLNRLRAQNVVDAEYDADDIYQAISRCLQDDDFQQVCSTCENPYGIGDAGKKIANVLATVEIEKALVQKRMMLQGECHEGYYR